MVLCFGTFVNILMLCSLQGTTNRSLVSELVGTIDQENKYFDKNNNSAVSRLVNCAVNFPVINVNPNDGPIRYVGGTHTNVVALAKNTDTSEIKNKFEPVIALLDEDKKAAVIGAMHHVIQNDETLESNHRSLFTKCMGDTAANILKNHNVDIKSFLAGLFLYTVLTNENTAGKDSLPEIKENGFIERFSSYPVNFCSAKTDVEETKPTDVIHNGLTSYMEALRNKYNRIPTILYKEALTPFNNYYVPNNIEWHKLIPGERFRYEIKIIQNVTITKLMEVSRYIVLSGTGGLGKSMMMRRLLISCIDNYKDQGLIPFFIPLKDYETSFNTMIEYVYAAASPLWSELSVESLENILTNGKAIFLFDGLDFIYDLINNLCLMYQDGLSYSFIHRSFQEYFCAKYFNAQLDELLVHVIPLFDRDDRTKKVDTALEMLYDMKKYSVSQEPTANLFDLME